MHFCTAPDSTFAEFYTIFLFFTAHRCWEAIGGNGWKILLIYLIENRQNVTDFSLFFFHFRRDFHIILPELRNCGIFWKIIVGRSIFEKNLLNRYNWKIEDVWSRKQKRAHEPWFRLVSAPGAHGRREEDARAKARMARLHCVEKATWNFDFGHSQF